MKTNKKTLRPLILAIILILVAGGWYGLQSRPQHPQTSETIAMNKLLAKANIPALESWRVYPNCGDIGRDDGYLLQVNNVSISSRQAAKLRSVATEDGLHINPRADEGYEIQGRSKIIVLGSTSPYLWASIYTEDVPKGFEYKGGVCS